MIFEICINSMDGVWTAKKYGVKRVELCSSLEVGGLTPSFGLIQQCAQQIDIEVHVMIRHSTGGFVYKVDEIEIMHNDIVAVKQAKAKGVVFGCLTNDNKINIEQNRHLVEVANSCGLTSTFHRAFDFCENPFVALELLIDLGFDRILTSGLQPTAIEGIDLITALVSQAKGRIEIMAGSGVNEYNALQIAKSGVDALHFTAQKSLNQTTEFNMGKKTIIDEKKIESIINLFHSK